MLFSRVNSCWISQEKVIKLFYRTRKSDLNYLLFLRIYSLRTKKISLDLTFLYLHFVLSLWVNFSKLFILLLILVVKYITTDLLSFPKGFHKLKSIIIFEASKVVLSLVAISFLHNGNERRITGLLDFYDVLNFNQTLFN